MTNLTAKTPGGLIPKYQPNPGNNYVSPGLWRIPTDTQRLKSTGGKNIVKRVKNGQYIETFVFNYLVRQQAGEVYFWRKERLNQGIVITRDKSGQETINGVAIRFLPAHFLV